MKTDSKNNNIPWIVSSDIGGFFGLFTNSLTNILTALGLLAFAISMPKDLVFGKIGPALALAVGLGNIYFALAAKRLAEKTNNPNVTALPYGVSVPHYFAVTFTVILPIYVVTKDWSIAMGVGAAWNLVQGLIMLLGAFIGPYLQKYIPRGALLGSLAGIALTWIAMTPMANVFLKPIVAFPALTIVIIGWLANKTFPFRIPAGLLAILVGTALGWITGIMDTQALVSSFKEIQFSYPSVYIGSLIAGLSMISPFLVAAIPLAIYDFLESLDNVESAHAQGEHYNTLEMMLVPALLTIGSSFLGNPFPTIIYIGHPGWKATGARIGYSLLTGFGVILSGILSIFLIFSSLIPLVALFPILVYIATVIGKQAFSSVKPKYFPALIIGLMPFIGSFINAQANNLLSSLSINLAEIGYDKIATSGVPLNGFAILGASDILVSMLLITIVIYAIDKRFKLSAVYALIASLLATFGFINSKTLGFLKNPEIVIGYALMALIFFAVSFYKPEENKASDNE